MSRKKKYNRWGNKNLWQTAARNDALYTMLRNQIIGMALTRYHWVNLPPTCDERYLELTLLTQGIATIGAPRSGAHMGQWLSLAVGSWQKAPDMYGNPQVWSAIGVNGTQFNVTPNNGYYCWDNHQRTPILPRIDLWVEELVDIINTMRQNRAHQKVPLIISGLQEKTNDLTNYVKQVAGGEIMVIATDGISNINAQAITPTNALPFIGEQLWANYLNIWNQIYNGLGINNLDFKRERMIEDEVTSLDNPTDLIALDGLQCRRTMCDYLNTHFEAFKQRPLNVVWASDYQTDNFKYLHNVKTYLDYNGDTNGND